MTVTTYLVQKVCACLVPTLNGHIKSSSSQSVAKLNRCTTSECTKGKIYSLLDRSTMRVYKVIIRATTMAGLQCHAIKNKNHNHSMN